MANRQIDDPYHRINAKDSYKNKVFNGKKTSVDAYTGEKIYYGNAPDAKRLHGIDRTADVDHVTPIAKVKERYGDLSIEQQRKIANNPEYNYAMTNSELNRHGKNALENHEYLKKKLYQNADALKEGDFDDAIIGTKELINETPKMLSAETKSRVGMAAEGNIYRLKNISEQAHRFLDEEDWDRLNRAGVNQAISAAKYAATISVIRNALSVVKGDEGIKDAADNYIKDTATAAAIGYATGFTAEKYGISTGDAAIIVNGSIQIASQIYAYVNGDVDESQLIQNVADNSAYLASAYIGKVFGGAIGTAGGPVGIFVGQYIGEMITTAFCSNVIDYIHAERVANKHHKQMLTLARNAEIEIIDSQDRLILLVNEENNQFVDTLNLGYDRFVDGLLNDNYEDASLGLATIGEGFGIEPDKLKQGHVEEGNVFGNKNRIINMGEECE